MTFDSHHVDHHLYFITASICGWKHLFADTAYINIVLDSLAWLQRNKRMALYAFVLLPSHLHAIAKPRDRPIGNLLQNFGSYTAHAILKELRRDKRSDLLKFFHEHRRDSRHQHSIWQDIQAKNVYSRKFLIQKLEYVHNNPVAKEWNLAEDRADYPYSSACFYDRDEPAIIVVDDVRQYL